MVIVILVLSFAASSVSAADMVFILSGQSNMRGVGKTQELSPELKELPKNLEYYSNGRKADFAKQKTFGPEVSFGHTLAKTFPKLRIILIKFAVGGTSLYAWEKDWKKERAQITKNQGSGSLYNKACI